MNTRLMLATAALAVAVPAAWCQQAPAPDSPAAPQNHYQMRADRHDGEMPPMAMDGDGPMRHGGMERGGMERGEMRMHHGGGHGEWWKNPEMVKRVGLTPEQTKKLDDISLQGKLDLIHLHATLQEQEVLMHPLMEGPAVDEKKADLQIDKVAEARAALEKAEAKLRLRERAVLTADQWTKMHTRPERPERPMGGPEGRHHGEGGPKPASFQQGGAGPQVL